MSVLASNPWVLPAIISGIGAIGQGMSAGAEGKLAGYGAGKHAPRRSDLTGTMLGDAMTPLEQTMAVHAGQAQTPISLGTQALVQPIPGLSGFDPALLDPSQITRPGINFGDRGPFSQPYRGPSSTPGGSSLGYIGQPVPAFPQPGRDIPQLMATLELLGVGQDSFGNFFTGANTNWDSTSDGWGGGDDSPYLWGQDPDAYDLERKFPARTPGSAENYDLPTDVDVRHPDYEGGLGETGGEGSETEGPGGPVVFTGATRSPHPSWPDPYVPPPPEIDPSAAVKQAIRRRRDLFPD